MVHLTADISIGIINTLSDIGKQHVSSIMNDYDLVIIDECHKLGADSFIKTLDVFSSSRFILALSGTPDRCDKKHNMYFNYFDNMIELDI